MHISPIGNFNLYKTTQKQTQYSKNIQTTGDIVSFSAKKKKPPQMQINHNVDFGVSIGEEVLSALTANKSKEEVFDILAKRMPSVSIGSVDELAEKTVLPNSFVAYFDSKLNDDFTQTNRRMYLDLCPFKVADDKQKLVYAMDIAHESTHAKQVDSGKDAKFYKKFSNGDADYAGTVISIGKFIFEQVDKTLQSKMLTPCFYDLESQMNLMRYNREIPSVANVSRQSILKNSGLTNYEEFKKVINAIYAQAFIQEMEYIVQNPDMAEKSIIDTLIKVIEEDKKEEFFEDMKKYCSYMATNEQEARTTECKLAKKTLKTNKSINIDCYPIYYEMISQALK